MKNLRPEDDYWYYLKGNGVMSTGWNDINNKTYYFYSNGKMATGDLYLDSNWYLLNEDGYRKIGWQKRSNDWNYYDGFEGALEHVNWNRINCMNYCYQYYIEMLAEAKKQRTAIHDTVSGEYMDEFGILKFVHPDKTYKQNNLDRDDGNINSYDYCLFNNDSAVLLIDYNDLQMLLASDIEIEAEQDMINMGLINSNSIDILKVPHHGYDTSNLKAFVDYINPGLAIIARSRNNYMDTNAVKTLISNRTLIKETWQNNGIEIIATYDGWNVY